MVQNFGHGDVGLVGILAVQVVAANLYSKPVGSLAMEGKKSKTSSWDP